MKCLCICVEQKKTPNRECNQSSGESSLHVSPAPLLLENEWKFIPKIKCQNFLKQKNTAIKPNQLLREREDSKTS